MPVTGLEDAVLRLVFTFAVPGLQVQAVEFIVGHAGSGDSPGQINAEVAVMPGLELIAGDAFLAFRIAQDPAVIR